MVRLKVRSLFKTNKTIILFQFQCGTIKSYITLIYNSKLTASFNSNVVRLKGRGCRSSLNLLTAFQFQCGTIKSHFERKNMCYIFRFNSNVVRLKEVQVNISSLGGSGFNSNVVRLKAGKKIIYPAIFIGFNSNVVRLKVYSPEDIAINIEVSIPMWYD